jgi:hypothetical protein
MNISEAGEIVIGICALIAVYMLTRQYHAWRMARAYQRIIKDLEEKKAVDSATAVDLPYARQSIIRMGIRNYVPKTLQYMTEHNIVGVTADGRYYLLHR